MSLDTSLNTRINLHIFNPEECELTNIY